MVERWEFFKVWKLCSVFCEADLQGLPPTDSPQFHCFLLKCFYDFILFQSLSTFFAVTLSTSTTARSHRRRLEDTQDLRSQGIFLQETLRICFLLEIWGSGAGEQGWPFNPKAKVCYRLLTHDQYDGSRNRFTKEIKQFW